MNRRRSLRLQEGGYYTAEGNPSISYKENLVTIFRRRAGRHHHHRQPNMDNNLLDHVDDDDDASSIFEITSRTETTASTPKSGFSVRIICTFLFLFLLLLLVLIGLLQAHKELRAVKEEMKSLRQPKPVDSPLRCIRCNYASKSHGAKVWPELSSDTFWPPGSMLDRILHWFKSSDKLQVVIQHRSYYRPGDCWCFAGDRGHLLVSLMHPVFVTHVSLGHISKGLSPVGHIGTAPKEFSIFGLRTVDDEGTYLGKLVYDEDNAAIQTFELPSPDVGVFQYVRLQIESNWGNKDHTCLYSFKVHGKTV